jgi:hypothetical protein
MVRGHFWPLLFPLYSCLIILFSSSYLAWKLIESMNNNTLQTLPFPCSAYFSSYYLLHNLWSYIPLFFVIITNKP